MAIQLTCEGCGRRVRVPDRAAGRKGKCPVCGRELLIPGEGPAARAAVESVAGAAPAPRDESSDGAGVSAPRETNALGVASLVLGILALPIAGIPMLGLLAWPLGGVGLLLGVIGLVLAARNRRWGTTSAIAGMATNGAAIALAMGVTFLAARALQDAAHRARLDEATNETRRDAPAPAPNGPAPAGIPAPDGTFAGQDRNGDGRLNADEVPDGLKARFAVIDADGDGYIEKAEWDPAATVAPATVPDAPPGRGKVIARRIFTAADDFVVDVWHNGRRVADDKRAMVGDNFGASAEQINVEVREGDWLVFNVANNRLRWGGACYFGAAGVNDEEPRIGFTTDPSDGRWSYCDDPARVPAFIAHPGYLADQAAPAPANPWGGGDGEMKARVPEWNGRPVWGRERTTWIKFVARPAPADKSEAAAAAPAARPEAAAAAPAVRPEAAAAAPAVRPEAAAAAPAVRPEAAAAAPAVTLTKRATFTGHPALVYCVAVSPDGRKVVSGSAPHFDLDSSRQDVKTLIVWDVADRGKTRGVIPIKQSVTSLAITPNGRSVVVPVDNGLSVVDLKTGRRTAVFPGPAQTNAMSVAVSPDGKVAAGGFTTKEVVLWSIKTGKPLRTLRGHTSGVIRLAFSPDGKQLASGGQDNAVRLWDVATGKSERALKSEGTSSPVTCVAYTPDGSRLASVNSGDGPQFWDPATGRHLMSLGGEEVLSYQFVCISPDGRRLATASLDPRKMKWAVVLWDAATGRRIATAEDGDGQVNAVAFFPDGAALAASGGNTVKVWDIAPAP